MSGMKHQNRFLKSVKINTWHCFPMRMFQSVSGHINEQSIAQYSSWPIVLQLKSVSDTISNWFENHQPQRTQISTVINAPFIQNSNRMASRLTATASFPSVFFQLLQYSRQRPSFSAHRAALMTKTDDLSSIVFKICRFRSSILLSLWVFIPRDATLESSLTVAWFSWTNHNSLLRIATNEIASFCIDNRLRQMAFFVVAKVGKGRLSSYVERFRNKRKLYM